MHQLRVCRTNPQQVHLRAAQSDDFDQRLVLEVPAHERTVEALVRKFRELGMLGRVYVLSSNPDWDGQKFQMSWFVAQFHATGFDSLAYRWKSQTAFYEQHHSGFTYFLRSEGPIVQ